MHVTLAFSQAFGCSADQRWGCNTDAGEGKTDARSSQNSVDNLGLADVGDLDAAASNSSLCQLRFIVGQEGHEAQEVTLITNDSRNF